VPSLSPAVEQALLAYAWPGNVRELRNVMERAVILSPAQVLEVEGLPERLRAQVAEVPVLGGRFTAEAIEREHILRVLATAPTMEEAARILGIDASTLWRKRKKLGR
jgi:NtrC-family two-component system response regulator AlgB